AREAQAARRTDIDLDRAGGRAARRLPARPARSRLARHMRHPRRRAAAGTPAEDLRPRGAAHRHRRAAAGGGAAPGDCRHALPGPPSRDGEAASLGAARRDAQLMSDEMSQVWLDVLGAECNAQPVLLLLEDMQWGDWPTMRFVDSALRHLAQCPLIVLGLGRP